MEIHTIGVIGAGPLGAGITRTAALAGYDVILEDVLPEMLEQGIASIERTLAAAVTRSEMKPDQKASALARIRTAAAVEDVCRLADLLIDALPEEFELKLEIFTIFDKFAKPGAILASATSTVLIADLAEMTYRQEDCIGLRFVHPVARMRRLEIICAPQTSDSTALAAEEFARRLGLAPAVVHESPAPAAGASAN